MSTWRQNTEPSLIITEIPLLQALWSHFPDLDWSFVGHREKSDQAAPETVLLKALPIPSSIGIRAVPRLFPMGLWTPLVLPPWLSLPAPYSLFCRALEPCSHLEPVFTELIPAGLCSPRSFSNKGLSGDGNPPWKTVYPLSLVAWRCPVEPHLLSWLILSISSKYHALLKRKSTSSWGNKVPLSASPMYISMEPLTSSRVYPHLPIYFIVC